MSVREMVGGLIPPTGPVRVLVWSMLGRSIAYGILLSVVVLFFTRSVHISAAELGVGLSVAAILKILVSVPAGHLTDRMGSRRAAIVFVVLERCAGRQLRACGRSSVSSSRRAWSAWPIPRPRRHAAR
jgi:MFS family permease